jgi:hypothetical protein
MQVLHDDRVPDCRATDKFVFVMQLMHKFQRNLIILMNGHDNCFRLLMPNDSYQSAKRIVATGRGISVTFSRACT